MKTLDIHGLNRFEVKIIMKSFLKESYNNRYKNVIITHGYGKLTLKKELYNLVKELDYIDSIEDAPYQLGGAGSTLISIKRKKYGKRI